jgi:hypothetical protein
MRDYQLKGWGVVWRVHSSFPPDGLKGKISVEGIGPFERKKLKFFRDKIK